MFVRFRLKTNERGAAEEEVQELTVITPSNRTVLGMQPLPLQQAGNKRRRPREISGYVVLGRITRIVGREVTVAAGSRTLKVKLAELPTIRLEVSDYRLAKPGHKLKWVGVVIEEYKGTERKFYAGVGWATTGKVYAPVIKEAKQVLIEWTLPWEKSLPVFREMLAKHKGFTEGREIQWVSNFKRAFKGQTGRYFVEFNERPITMPGGAQQFLFSCSESQYRDWIKVPGGTKVLFSAKTAVLVPEDVVDRDPIRVYPGFSDTRLMRTATPVRIFTDITGQYKVEAEFLEVAGEHVRLKKEDGSTVRVSLERLSKQDREWIQQRPE